MKTVPVLQENDVVCLLSPASPFADDTLLETSVRALEDLGFRVRVFASAKDKNGYLASDDEVRAADVNRAFADDEVRAVFCTRGGYGCMRILPLLDYEMIRAHPKPLIGLSDVTALHLALYEKAGLRTLHAPMPFRYPELPKTAMQRLKALLTGQNEATYTKEDGLFTIRVGKAEGEMLGGNLTLVTCLLESEYLPDFTGKILFLEEVGEEEYRIDRLLTTLALSGRLDTLGGIVFGGFTDCGREDKIREILFSCTPKHIPVLGGFPAGHLQNNHAFCEGARVTLDATHATLYFHPHEEE